MSTMVSSARLRTERLTATDSSSPSLCQADAGLEGPVEDEFGEGDDEPGSFGQGDEHVGGEGAVFGVGPADEGFDAGDAAGGEVDLGLVVDVEETVVDRGS